MLTAEMRTKYADFYKSHLTVDGPFIAVRNRMRKFGTPRLNSWMSLSGWEGSTLTIGTHEGDIVVPNVVRVVTFSYGCKVIVMEGEREQTAVELYKPGPSLADEAARIAAYEESRRGERLGFMLVQATEKAVRYDRYKRQLIEHVSSDNLTKLVDDSRELVAAAHKTGIRNLELKSLIGDHLLVRVTSKDSGLVLAQGHITYIKPEESVIQITDTDGQATKVTYAKELPVPKECDQLYWGHEQIVQFEVLYLAPYKDYVLH